MKNTMDSTGCVPVTVEIPAALVESLQSGRYDCGPLLEFLAGGRSLRREWRKRC